VLLVAAGAVLAFALDRRDTTGALMLPLTAAQVLWINLMQLIADLSGNAAIPVELWGVVFGGALLAWGLKEGCSRLAWRQHPREGGGR
jgi:hypothetical protein